MCIRDRKKGFNVLIDVDTQGARILQKNKGFKAVYIFILPPSVQELKRRLIKRKSEGKKELEKRLKEAKKEIKQAKRYDYCIVNENIARAVKDIKAVMRAESLSKSRYLWRKK